MSIGVFNVNSAFFINLKAKTNLVILKIKLLLI